MNIGPAIPMFRIFDVEKAKAFYVDFLGFAVDWEHHIFDGSPLYMQISRDGLLLHLTEHHGDCCPGSAALVWMTGIEDFHREIKARLAKGRHLEIEDAPWGARLLKFTDPFGNRLLFNEKRAKTSS